jgi:iron complex outermembrane recepter protein
MDPVMAHLEPEQIEQVEIVKGPYLMEYGSSPAASIRIATNKGIQQFTKGKKLNVISGYETNRNAWRHSLNFRKSNGKIFYALAGGLKSSDDYKDGNDEEWESSFKKYFLSADAGYRSDRNSIFIVSWKGSFARDVMFPALPMDEIKDNTQIFSGQYNKLYPSDPSKSLNISLYHTSVYHLMDNSFRPQYTKVVPPLTGIMQSEAGVYTRSSGFRTAFSKKYSEIDIESGIDVHLITKNGTREMKMIMEMGGQQYTNIKLTNLWNNSVIMNGGVFGKVSSAKNRFSYNATVRLDLNHSHSSDTLNLLSNGENMYDYEAVNRLLPAISSGFYYRLAKNTIAGLAFAYSCRAPDMQERYIKFLATGYDRFDYLGDPQLKPETNLQADMVLNYINGSTNFSINLFASEIYDYITGLLVPPTVARPQSLGAPGVKQFSNIDKAIFTGFETSGGFLITSYSELSFSAGYTLAWYPEIEKVVITDNQPIHTILIKNDPVAEMPALDGELQYKYNIAKLNLKPAFIIKATAPQNRVSGSYGEEETPGYVIADINLVWNPSRLWMITAGVKNILNTSYYDHLNRRLLSTGPKLYEPGRSVFILLKLSI